MPNRVAESSSVVFTRREFKLVELCQRRREELTNAVARQHLWEGFIRRVLLNHTSRLSIERVADPERTEVLNVGSCSELNVHLNSFYIQMRGALDNLVS